MWRNIDSIGRLPSHRLEGAHQHIYFLCIPCCLEKIIGERPKAQPEREGKNQRKCPGLGRGEHVQGGRDRSHRNDASFFHQPTPRSLPWSLVASPPSRLSSLAVSRLRPVAPSRSASSARPGLPSRSPANSVTAPQRPPLRPAGFCLVLP
jgi:hypothetical protein